MQFLSKIIILVLVIFLSNCSRMNRDTVNVFIDSDPSGSDVYINDQYYGQTPTIAEVVPDKDYQLVVKKNGFISKSITMESAYSLRKGARYDTPDYKRCVLDTIGSFLIFPYFSLHSVKCRNFTQNRYVLHLDDAPPSQPAFNQGTATNPASLPSTQQPYYAPLSNQNNAPAADKNGQPPIQSLPFDNRPDLNNKGSNYIFYPDKKIDRPKDYYKWQ